MAQQFDFMSAKLAHQRWRVRLRLFLDGVENLSLSEATSPHDCALGQWIDSTGLKEFGHLNEMHTLERLHVEMHGKVREVIELQQRNDTDGAEREYMALEPLSNQIIDLLGVVESRVS